MRLKVTDERGYITPFSMTLLLMFSWWLTIEIAGWLSVEFTDSPFIRHAHKKALVIAFVAGMTYPVAYAVDYLHKRMDGHVAWLKY